MFLIKYITNKFTDTNNLNNEFTTGKPLPSIVFDDFLPKEFVTELYNESMSIPDEYWKIFTRKGSHMMETTNLNVAPIANEFVNQMHSHMGMKWLSSIVGIPELISDPYIVGAGYSKSFNGDTLQVHSDFNWNDTLKLHRALSLIIYITPTWKPEYGGGLEFYDYNNKEIIKTVDCNFNRCLIWQHHKRGFHGYKRPIESPNGLSRNAFKLFFYVSKAEYDPEDPPHRSLYWYDENSNQPYDNRDEI